MDKVISLGFLFAIMAAVFFLLYWNGLMIVNAKSAVSFVGSARGKRAVFTACNGHIRRIVRFRDERPRTFTLKTELSKGEVSAELLESGKEKVMMLDGENPTAVVSVKKGRRYDLVIRFRSATGNYILNCEVN